MKDIIIRYNKDKDYINTNSILDKIDIACRDHGLDGIDALHELSTNRYNNILLDVGYSYINSLNIITDGKSNYNIDNIYKMLDIYKYLCKEYDKRLSVYGFCNICGLDYDSVFSEGSLLNHTLHSISKKLDIYDNDLQLDKARDSKQSILNLAYNNYRHNWSGQIKAQETTATVNSLADISRKLSLTDGQSKNN